MSAAGEKQPWFDHRMSIGNLITIGTVLVAIIYGWASFDGRLAAMESEMARATGRLDRLENERTDLHTRVIRIEEKISTQNDTLQRILRNTERP